ncbi:MULTISPECIES: transketolase [unclassified Sphingobium]|uniref:transketolase n=1 Tax=unclassified Sphingobium TaxID=2611147 RepID=UPI000D166D02|nr:MULTISPECIES: transketolase [unclassified Sphingobium]MBG6116833.1 transketolase [Sphingobium sp. JAI105]PSO12075.1 transketolase [Sphingobium sp. AEW4]TWD02834.1 transketolase [Sphingobium sp. AEW010]TWD20968.1 transketolase [Sphingobium sp. AEW013]TWD23743.1 transketolase [Sphingobium sp. AEW001]
MTVSDKSLANAIRALSMDAVQAANSGHPGMPMGMADVATVLFSDYLKFDPTQPKWADRDRFVLSAGHGSMLIYSLLHLTGYARPTIEDIANFRQLHSPCAGHPENFELAGVEATTGPLGSGLATAVGMAIAERHLNAQFGDALVDHRTWVIAGDGCLMEGINHEAIGLAGHLNLGRLIVLWDDNKITIDGAVDLSSSEDVRARYEATGWHVVSCDGHDVADVRRALAEAVADSRPSLVACATKIGYGSPNKAGTSGVHGSALGEAEVAAAREFLGWDAAPFVIPEDIAAAWQAIGAKGSDVRAAWEARLASDAKGAEFTRRMAGDLPDNFSLEAYIDSLIAAPQKVATRKASELALGAINDLLPETLGGSADLTGSNNTKTKSTEPLTRDDYAGRYVYYGIREFGMACAMNGMALHGGVIPYGGTFLVFSDYMRAGIRLAALQQQRVIHVLTHDSIGLGEDGPTHQPIEHVMSMRMIPNLDVYRPADIVETAECWELALKDATGPSVLALTRQNLPQLRTEKSENLSSKGAYRLVAATAERKVVLIATGSEVEIAVDTARALEEQGIGADVVSMPSWTHFDAQPQSYKDDLLPHHVLRVSIEAGTTFGWERHTGIAGLRFGIDSFGASAPAEALYDHFGLTAAKIAPQIVAALNN